MNTWMKNSGIYSVIVFTLKAVNGLRLCVISVIILSIPVTANADESITPPAEITFLTWSEYISEDVVAEFENQYNAKVNFVYYESDDARDEMLVTYGADGYDLILIDSVNITLYKQLNWITSFDINNAPNLNHVKLPVLSNLTKKIILARLIPGAQQA